MSALNPSRLHKRSVLFSTATTTAGAATSQGQPRLCETPTGDFIHHSLYDPDGYFNARDVITTPQRLLNFNEMLGKMEYEYKLDQLYKEKEYGWLTPVEIFAPLYSEAIARYIVTEHLAAGQRKGVAQILGMTADQRPAWAREARVEDVRPLVIYEVGGGNGTNALHILNFLRNNHPALYARTEYRILEVSPRLQRLQATLLEQAGHAAPGYGGDTAEGGCARALLADARRGFAVPGLAAPGAAGAVAGEGSSAAGSALATAGSDRQPAPLAARQDGAAAVAGAEAGLPRMTLAAAAATGPVATRGQTVLPASAARSATGLELPRRRAAAAVSILADATALPSALRDERPCFVIGCEVLDNLRHDKLVALQLPSAAANEGGLLAGLARAAAKALRRPAPRPAAASAGASVSSSSGGSGIGNGSRFDGLTWLETVVLSKEPVEGAGRPDDADAASNKGIEAHVSGGKEAAGTGVVGRKLQLQEALRPVRDPAVAALLPLLLSHLEAAEAALETRSALGFFKRVLRRMRDSIPFLRQPAPPHNPALRLATALLGCVNNREDARALLEEATHLMQFPPPVKLGRLPKPALSLAPSAVAAVRAALGLDAGVAPGANSSSAESTSGSSSSGSNSSGRAAGSDISDDGNPLPMPRAARVRYARYVPTGCYHFLRSLRRVLPSHRLVLADFSVLPPPAVTRRPSEIAKENAVASYTPAACAPVVSSRNKDSRAPVDHPTYMSPPVGAADIFFPTCFALLARMVALVDAEARHEARAAAAAARARAGGATAAVGSAGAQQQLQTQQAQHDQQQQASIRGRASPIAGGGSASPTAAAASAVPTGAAARGSPNAFADVPIGPAGRAGGGRRSDISSNAAAPAAGASPHAHRVDPLQQHRQQQQQRQGGSSAALAAQHAAGSSSSAVSAAAAAPSPPPLASGEVAAIEGVTVMSSHEFLNRFGEPSRGATMLGYNPLLEEYPNTRFLLT